MNITSELLDLAAGRLGRIVRSSTAHLSVEERVAGVRQMLADLEQLARADGCIAAAWALEFILCLPGVVAGESPLSCAVDHVAGRDELARAIVGQAVAGASMALAARCPAGAVELGAGRWFLDRFFGRDWPGGVLVKLDWPEAVEAWESLKGLLPPSVHYTGAGKVGGLFLC